ncbi:antibiotic biosynthesis monooxygenase [Knoellia sp. CPCC 206453]|uniref:antibiotic biosynthesis monooxygenase n=1 Tax=Knoellia pratensis TaxID=3404796 RepID=UPI003611B1A6
MYARTTTIQADPSKIDDGIAHMSGQVTPVITAMDGCVGMSMLADRASGRCIATSSWESEAALKDSAERVRSLREGAMQAMGGSTSTVDTWEAAVVHRDHAMPEGACARVTWLSGMDDHAERAADVFRMVVLPKAQELDGFCSASLLINRETGRAVGTVTFERREQLEASRDAAQALRETASRDIGATIDDVAEMEVAFAHLHLPEMA